MVRKGVFVLILAALLGGVAYWLFAPEDPARAIRERCEELARRVSKAENEGSVASLGAAQGLSGLFVEGCRFKLDQPRLEGEFSREAIASRALLFRAQFTRFTVTLHDFEAKLPGPGEAEAEFSALLAGTPVSGETVREARDIKARLRKVDGKWLIESVEAADPIRK